MSVFVSDDVMIILSTMDLNKLDLNASNSFVRRYPIASIQLYTMTIFILLLQLCYTDQLLQVESSYKPMQGKS